MKKILLLFLVLVISSVKAKLVGFPDEAVQLGYQPNKAQAIWHLFNGQAKDIRERSAFRNSGAQHDSVFTAKFKGKDWFVKTVLIDLEDEEPMHYEYDWELKIQKEKYAPLKKVNGEIVFADRAAFFTLNSNLYYVASYPFVPGKTINSIVEQYIEDKQPTGSRTFYKALYRYAKVAALLHFNPDKTPTPEENILERPVQIYLEDRNGFNELYDQASDTIYLIDYSLEHDNYRVSIPVKNYLLDFIDLFGDPIYKDVCGVNKACLPIIINTFIKGYSDALPKYGYDLVSRTIRNYILMIAEKGCNEEINISIDDEDRDPEYYCELKKLLWQMTPSK